MGVQSALGWSSKRYSAYNCSSETTEGEGVRRQMVFLKKKILLAFARGNHLQAPSGSGPGRILANTDKRCKNVLKVVKTQKNKNCVRKSKNKKSFFSAKLQKQIENGIRVKGEWNE